MFEFYHAAGFVSFDGRIVESWSNGSAYTGRLHIAVIRDVTIQIGLISRQQTVQIQTIYGSGNMMFPIENEHRPQAEQLIAAIKSAKAAAS